jgi:hypothetical protein
MLPCPTVLGELCRSVDIYCERTSSAFFAEPLNALTNIGFLIAAYAAWRIARRDGASPLVRVLIWVTVAIGVGSFLFHTVATRWASLADIVPISVFMLLYLWLALRTFLRWSPLTAGLGLVAYVAASAILPALIPPGLAAGGAGYLPALVAMLAVGLAALRTDRTTGARLILAGCAFLVSLAARTADIPACASLPIGTHFLWHALNAIVLYLLLRTALTHPPTFTRPPSVIPAQAGTQ